MWTVTADVRSGRIFKFRWGRVRGRIWGNGMPDDVGRRRRSKRRRKWWSTCTGWQRRHWGTITGVVAILNPRPQRTIPSASILKHRQNWNFKTQKKGDQVYWWDWGFQVGSWKDGRGKQVEWEPVVSAPHHCRGSYLAIDFSPTVEVKHAKGRRHSNVGCNG